MTRLFNSSTIKGLFIRINEVHRELGTLGLIRSAIRAIAWPILKYKFKEIKCKVQNYTLWVNTYDFGLSRELFMYGIHEPITTELIKKNLREGMHAVDIGSNIGYYVILEAKIVGDKGKVIAIEPYPDSVSLLKKNIKFNKVENVVEIFEIAVGKEDGYMRFYIYDQANWNSLIPFHKSKSSIIVKVSPLDKIINLERVHFIRLDVEGFEPEVIEGSIEIIKKNKPLLCIELHPHIRDPEAIKNMLLKLEQTGYYVKYGYYRKKDLIGVGSINDAKNIKFSYLLENEGPINKRLPYTVWLECGDKR